MRSALRSSRRRALALALVTTLGLLSVMAGSVGVSSADPIPATTTWTGNGAAGGVCNTVGLFDDLDPPAGQQGWLFILTKPWNTSLVPPSVLTASFDPNGDGILTDAIIVQADGFFPGGGEGSVHIVVYAPIGAKLISASATNGTGDSAPPPFGSNLTVSHCELGGTVGTPRSTSTISTKVHLGDDPVAPDLPVDQTGQSVPLGSTVHDSAVLEWSGTPAPALPAGSTVTFRFFTGAGCLLANVESVSTPVPVSGDTGMLTLDNQLPKGPLGAGVYGYLAFFDSGDDTVVNDAVGLCEPITVNKAQLGITTALHLGTDTGTPVADVQNTSVALGSSIHDSATVTGIVAGFVPANNVGFTFHGSNTVGNTNVGNCDAADPTTAAGSVALVDGVAHPSDTVGPLHAGKYGFTASLAGDDNYLGGTSACEPITVNKAQLGITTDIHLGTDHTTDYEGLSVPVNSTIHDSATVTGLVGTFAPGNVDFTFYGSNTLGNTNVGSCNANDLVTSAGSVAVVNGVAHPSTAFGPLYAGNFGFKASVAGNGDYIGATSACEPITVNPQFGKTMGFWGNRNGIDRITNNGGYLSNSVAIGRGAIIDTQAEAAKIFPNSHNACGKGSPIIFTVGAATGTLDCTVATGVNRNSLNTLASQTLALGYNIKLVSGYNGQTVGNLQCTGQIGATGLTSASTVDAVFTAAVALINGSAQGGSTTQAQIGAMNTLLGCVNREA
jgi:hypothetical protein